MKKIKAYIDPSSSLRTYFSVFVRMQLIYLQYNQKLVNKKYLIIDQIQVVKENTHDEWQSEYKLRLQHSYCEVVSFVFMNKGQTINGKRLINDYVKPFQV